MTHSTKIHNFPTIFELLRPLDFGLITLTLLVNSPHKRGETVFLHIPTTIAVGICPQFFGFCPTTYRGLGPGALYLGTQTFFSSLRNVGLRVHVCRPCFIRTEGWCLGIRSSFEDSLFTNTISSWLRAHSRMGSFATASCPHQQFLASALA